MMQFEPIKLNTIELKGFSKPASIKSGGVGFQDVFKQAWDNVEGTQNDVAQKQYLQSIGALDDTHTLPIAQSKAELALDLLVNLRNKTLESYNELMRINV